MSSNPAGGTLSYQRRIQQYCTKKMHIDYDASIECLRHIIYDDFPMGTYLYQKGSIIVINTTTIISLEFCTLKAMIQTIYVYNYYILTIRSHLASKAIVRFLH